MICMSNQNAKQNKYLAVLTDRAAVASAFVMIYAVLQHIGEYKYE